MELARELDLKKNKGKTSSCIRSGRRDLAGGLLGSPFPPEDIRRGKRKRERVALCSECFSAQFAEIYEGITTKFINFWHSHRYRISLCNIQSALFYGAFYRITLHPHRCVHLFALLAAAPARQIKFRMQKIYS